MQSCIVPVVLNINSNETIISCGKTLAIQEGTWKLEIKCMCGSTVLVPGPSTLQVTESWVGARCLELLIPQRWDYILYMLTTLLEIQLMFYAKYRFSSLGICPIRLTLQRLFQQLQVHHILV